MGNLSTLVLLLLTEIILLYFYLIKISQVCVGIDRVQEPRGVDRLVCFSFTSAELISIEQ